MGVDQPRYQEFALGVDGGVGGDWRGGLDLSDDAMVNGDRP